MRKLNNILIISLAAFFLLAGNGVNLIEYCCNLCKDKGIVEALTTGCHEAETHSCCDHSANNTAEGCNVLTDDAHKCHLTRYTLDDQEFSSKNSLQIITTTALPRFSLEAVCPSVSPIKNFPSIGYVHHCGRCLLSHICVLTI